MVLLKNLSRIAIGTYRMHNSIHLNTVRYAIECGFNMVDTASNYMDGRSEEMIGKLSKVEKESLFIVSKAGYVHGRNIEILDKADIDSNKTIQVSESLMYCISPNYLLKQIDESRKRLGVDTIDCYLLHNPEYYLHQNSSLKMNLYEDIKSAFNTLEDLRKRNIIRFYGISSNTLPAPAGVKGVDLTKILSLIDIHNYHKGFKFIQFPYNLCEKAASHKNYGSDSLIELSKRYDLHLMSNRPLNAHSKKGFVRLADFNKGVRSEAERSKDDQTSYNKLISCLDKRLQEIDQSAELFTYQPIRTLSRFRTRFGNYEAVLNYYRVQLLPFINHLYDNSIPTDVTELLESLITSSKEYTYIKMKLKSEQVKLELIGPAGNNVSFSTKACQTYIESGIDHIAIGMRKRQYVDEIKELL